MNKLSQSDRKWAEGAWSAIQTKMEAETKRMAGKIPYAAVNGVYRENKAETDPCWWTNGFWPGMLWQMFHATGNEIYKNAAREAGAAINTNLETFTSLSHDVGFMWLHSAVADYRLTKDEKAKVAGLHAATILAGRYNLKGQFLRAWNGDRTGWMIIDCMMNLPLLYWASAESDDPRFSYVAEAHADTTLRVGIRPDGSCNHIVCMDPATGEVLETPGGQGYEAGSSWSRGQAWAMYGMALSYRHTGKTEYLDAAKRVAHYFIANVAETDYVPLIDFRAPEEPVGYDTIAGVCAACGMLEIADSVGELEQGIYRGAAIRILKAIDSKHGIWNPELDGMIDCGTAAYFGRKEEYQVPIVYADYFFIEGVLRLLGKEFLIW